MLPHKLLSYTQTQCLGDLTHYAETALAGAFFLVVAKYLILSDNAICMLNVLHIYWINHGPYILGSKCYFLHVWQYYILHILVLVCHKIELPIMAVVI